MNFENFLLFLKDKGLKYQHFEKALELRENLDYKLALVKLRELSENIRDDIYEKYNITRNPKPNLFGDFELMFKNIIDFTKILSSEKVEKSTIVKQILFTISFLINIINIASHDNPDPSTFERHTSNLALSLASTIFPYFFHILKPLIEISEIENLNDLIKFSQLIYESKKFEYKQDYLAEFQSYDDQIKDLLIDLHGHERNSVSELDSRKYGSAISSINDALKELDQIRQSKGKRYEYIYNCIETRLYLRQGFIYRMKGQEDPRDYATSIQIYEKAMEKVEEITNKNLKNCYKLMCHTLLADVYRVMSTTVKSHESIKEAQGLMNELKKESLKVNNFCLAYLYNQLGLIYFQKGIAESGMLESALEFHIKSIIHFFKAQRRRWILKVLIDLCACLYVITLEKDIYSIDDVDVVCRFLEGMTELDHSDYQYKHNINLIRSKYLMLKDDNQSLSEAHQLTNNLITHHKTQNLFRAMGAEMVVLGEIMLFQNDIGEGIANIKDGLNLLNDHKQVQLVSLYEIEKISHKLPIETKEIITEILEEYSHGED